MKTLVLCVDRDDDIGAKTGIQGPIVGRDANLAAAMRLGIADPEDSDVNALFSAISIYDGYRKENPDAEIATICGDAHVGTVSDIALTRQLDQILRDVRPERVFLVSDGAEDEAFSPIISSRIRVDHVRRVYVRQTPTAESLYYRCPSAASVISSRRAVNITSASGTPSPPASCRSSSTCPRSS